MVWKPARSRVTSVVDSGFTTAATATRASDGRPSDGQERIGTTLGNYQLLAIVGEGGMGRVYLAEHKRLGRRVALKLLRPEQASRRNAVARFFQEARVVNRVRHRNIVDIPDLVELDDGTVFIVMELLEGSSLRELLRADGPPPIALTIEIGVQICRALEAAHAVGVLHRDLKPANVHVAADRSSDAWVKLLDFGIAKLSEVESSSGVAAPDITGEGAIIGTPIYMSPEQATASPVDPRTDLYSLGVILYELVAGSPPFTGAGLPELVWAHCSQPPPPLPAAVPPALDALIRHCLAKRPHERPASATAVREALLAIDTQPPPRRVRWRPALIAALVAVVVGVVLAFAFGGGSERPTPAAATEAPPPPAPAAAAAVPAIDAATDPPAVGATAPPATPAGEVRRRKPRADREPVAPASPPATPSGSVRDRAYTVDPFRDEGTR